METLFESFREFAIAVSRAIASNIDFGEMNDYVSQRMSDDDMAFWAFVVVACLILLLVALAIAIASIAWVFISEKRALKAMRDIVQSNGFQSAKNFMSNWIVKGAGGRKYGYKYMDHPGCYVILSFNAPVEDSDFSNPAGVYVGQSVHVFSRVRSHFSGKGNGDVYADFRDGRYVYVSFWLCKAQQLNSLEKRLIKAYNATSYYNKTRGGGSRKV